MNNCVLMAEITTPPQLRHTPDNLELSEMLVEFPGGTRPEDPPATLRVIGWGQMASEIHANYRQGDRVLIEGRLSINSIQRDGFKEKRAELTVQRIHSLGSTVITTTAPAPVSERTPATTNTTTAARTNSTASRPPATNNTPSYDEQPLAIPERARSNVGVMPQESYSQSAPQPRSFDPSTYPAMDDVQDEDDIPF